jgi:hypothetical protein
MKVSVQVYGMIIVFALMIFIIPELLNFGVYFSHLNSLSSYVVEVIEVNEGVNDNVLTVIETLQAKNPGFEIEYTFQQVSNNYKVYDIKVKTNMKLNVLKMDYNLESNKKSKRVLY